MLVVMSLVSVDMDRNGAAALGDGPAARGPFVNRVQMACGRSFEAGGGHGRMRQGTALVRSDVGAACGKKPDDAEEDD